MISRDDVIAYLRQCPGSELAAIMEKGLPFRPESEAEGEAFEYQMILGQARRENVSQSPGEIEWSEWQISAAAYADHDNYPENFPGKPYCQGGACDNCQVELGAHVKNARCPICNAKVCLT